MKYDSVLYSTVGKLYTTYRLFLSCCALRTAPAPVPVEAILTGIVPVPRTRGFGLQRTGSTYDSPMRGEKGQWKNQAVAVVTENKHLEPVVWTRGCKGPAMT
jgi:hypothetical protein